MTRITYEKRNDTLEVSNLMMTKEGQIIFVEIDFNQDQMYIKDIEGECLFSCEFTDADEVKRQAREKCIEIGVYINTEIRSKDE